MINEIPKARDDEYREVAWGKKYPHDHVRPMWINNPKPQGKFIRFDLHYCGVCHSDLHVSDNDFGNAMYPLVPGHELAGVITEVGPEVTKFKLGDRVGMGPICDSCMDCETCFNGE